MPQIMLDSQLGKRSTLAKKVLCQQGKHHTFNTVLIMR